MTMTPVYDVGTADWKANSCGINTDATTLNTSVLSVSLSVTTLVAALAWGYSFTHDIIQLLVVLSRRSFLFFFQSHNDHTADAVTKTRIASLLPGEKFSHTREVLSVTSRTHAIIDTDVLWRQIKFDLKATDRENTVLDDYIKEKSADYSTTATDEEK